MISFIVPCYKKRLPTFKRSIESLLDQSYQDIEVILSFDGPDPVLEGYADELIVKHPFTVKKVVNPWGGACKARNAGFEASKGNIISWWDADCVAEPEMASVWMMFFDQHPDCDFVYGQYKWLDRDDLHGYDSEAQFDPWVLTRYNYLCSMWPIRREKAVKWDESLTGLQDWAFWREVVANGAKGYFNRGYGFATEFPDVMSISGAGLEKKNERLRAIRAKFNDPKRDILVLGYIHKPQAIRIAKLLDADYFMNTDYYNIDDHKLILSVGFNYQEMPQISKVFKESATGTKRAIYWTGMDCMELACGPYQEVKKWRESIKESVHYNFCPDVAAQKILEDIGIDAQILPLPRNEGKLLPTLPEKFKVLVFADDKFTPFTNALIAAMPGIQFDRLVPEKVFMLEDYSLVIRLTGDGRLNDGDVNALIQGRHMISNVQAPYAGYIELGPTVEAFLNEAINRVYGFEKEKEINQEARDYYYQETEPDSFKKEIEKLIVPELKVIA